HREPQVLAAPTGGQHGPPGEKSDEVGGSTDMSPDRPVMGDGNGLDRAADDALLQPAPDDLDLGQLWQGATPRPRPAPGLRRSATPRRPRRARVQCPRTPARRGRRGYGTRPPSPRPRPATPLRPPCAASRPGTRR